MALYEFEFRTGRALIDHTKCGGCTSYACVKACSLYGRRILRLQGGKPVLSVPRDEAKRLCIECLACEWDCLSKGKGAITLVLPIQGLEDG